MLSQGDEALYATKVLSITDNNYRDAIAATTDLAYFTRLFGNGLDCGAYECQEALNRVIYVDPNKVTTSGDGRSWENAYGMNRLQNAIDAASVYIQTTTADSDEGQKDDEVFAYVFVKGKRDGSTGESITLRKGVQVYGSIDPGYTAMAEISNDNTGDVVTSNIWAYEKKIRDERPGLAGTSTYRTIVESVTTTEEEVYDVQTVLDGFVVKASAERQTSVVNLQGGKENKTQNALAMRNCIVAGNTVTGDGQPVVNIENGLLYNVLVQENNSGDDAPIVKVGTNGYMVNCTVVASEEGKSPIIVETESSNTVLNSIAFNTTETIASPFAPYLQPGTTTYHANKPAYLTDNHYLWYQLHEVATDYMEKADEDVHSKLPDALRNQTDKFIRFIVYGDDRDVLGNPRKLETVDLGCFETWNIMEGTTTELTDTYRPAEGSVVYVHKDANLKLNENMTSIFNPGYLLLSQGASLYGQGAKVSLGYVAVEKEIKTGYSLLALPYDYSLDNTVSVTYEEGGTLIESAIATAARAYTYNGMKRAAYDYHFVTDDSPCWEMCSNSAVLPANKGVLYTGVNAGTYRFTAFAPTASSVLYTEGGDELVKSVTLKQYNATPTSGAYFTTTENMGWNLVGQPYLVNNYETAVLADDGTYQMNIPHVYYLMDNATGKYLTVQSWETNRSLSLGNAFFTQTATLGNEEFLKFKLPVFPTTKTIDTRALLCMAGESGTDEVQLTPNTKVDAMQTYQVNYDGVKMSALNKEVPQLYALGTQGNRLSLIGSAPVEQEIKLGYMSSKDNETYTISLPNPEAFKEYGSVWLKDKKTGMITDLMCEDYTFKAEMPGTQDGRLTVKIGGLSPIIESDNMSSNSHTLYVNKGVLHVMGLTVGEMITIYTIDGRMIQQVVATDEEYSMPVTSGVYIVKIGAHRYKVL